MFANATAEQLARVENILRQLDQAQAGDPNANRRRVKRVTIHTPMTALLLCKTGDASLAIFSRNFSTSGIGFVCRRLCKPGERLALCLELPNRPRKLVLAQITFCRYVRAGLYEAGAEFMECATGGEVNERIPPHWIPCVQAKGGVLPPGPRAPATTSH